MSYDVDCKHTVHDFRVMCATWNVNGQSPLSCDLKNWLLPECEELPDIYADGFVLCGALNSVETFCMHFRCSIILSQHEVFQSATGDIFTVIKLYYWLVITVDTCDARVSCTVISCIRKFY